MCELTVETDCVDGKGAVAPSPVRKLSFLTCQPMAALDTARVNTGFSLAQTAVRSPVGLLLSSKKSRVALAVESNAGGDAGGDLSGKAAPRQPVRVLPDMPMDVWGRVFDFLLLPGTAGACCSSGDAVLSVLAAVLPAHQALTQVCRAWHAWLRQGPAYQPSALHATLFGTTGNHRDIIERMQLLRSYSSLMEQRHVAEHCPSTSQETRQCLRECMQRAMEALSAHKWRMHIEFAGIFWNHASPPVAELLSLEAHAHAILNREQAASGVPSEDEDEDEEDLCTSVASAMQDPSLIQEFQRSKFLVLHMADQDNKTHATQNGAKQDPSFDLMLDRCEGWRRSNSLKFSGTQAVRSGAGVQRGGSAVAPKDTAALGASGEGGDGQGCVLAGLPWDVHLELGNCSLLRSASARVHKEVLCLMSLSSYSGTGIGTELLLLGRLPHFSFQETDLDHDSPAVHC